VPPKGWQAFSTITVYISESFTPAQRDAIMNAYNNWSTRENAGILPQRELFPGPLPRNQRYPSSIWVFYDDPDCPPESLACTHDGWCPQGIERSTRTNVVPGYGGTGDQLFAHEVGHTFGIDECIAGDCGGNVTIMNPAEADQPFAPMSPHCCDSRLMYQISGGSYGQPSRYCSPFTVQGTSQNPGTAFLTPYPGSQTSVQATFPKKPQSGDTIIAGCLEINYGSALPTVTDNQGGHNGYQPIVGAYVYYLGHGNIVPVAFYAATQNYSDQSKQFTLTCTSDHPDTINLFALEFADLGDATHIFDSNAVHQGGIGPPYNCGTLTTTAVDDLIMSIDNDATPYSPAGLSPTLGTIPFCGGGEGGQCVAQNSQAYEAGGISTYTATSAGQYTPAWNYSHGIPMDCASMALKVIGPPPAQTTRVPYRPNVE